MDDVVEWRKWIESSVLVLPPQATLFSETSLICVGGGLCREERTGGRTSFAGG